MAKIPTPPAASSPAPSAPEPPPQNTPSPASQQLREAQHGQDQAAPSPASQQLRDANGQAQGASSPASQQQAQAQGAPAPRPAEQVTSGAAWQPILEQFMRAKGNATEAAERSCPCSDQIQEANGWLTRIYYTNARATEIIGTILDRMPEKMPGGEGGGKKDGDSGPGWFTRAVDGLSSGMSSMMANRYAPATKVLRNAPKALGKAGKFIGGAIGGAVGGPEGQVAGSMAGEAIGMAAGKFVGAAGLLIDGTVKLTNAFNERSRELMMFSPAIAQSQAQTQVKNLMADMREANELGGDMAKIQNSSTDIWIEIRDILLPIKKVVGELLGGFLEIVLDFIRYVRPGVEAIIAILEAGFKAVVHAIQFERTKAIQDIKEGLRKVEDAFKEKKPQGDVDLWKDLLADIPRIPGVGPAQRPNRGFMGGIFGLPGAVGL